MQVRNSYHQTGGPAVSTKESDYAWLSSRSRCLLYFRRRPRAELRWVLCKRNAGLDVPYIYNEVKQGSFNGTSSHDSFLKGFISAHLATSHLHLIEIEHKVIESIEHQFE